MDSSGPLGNGHERNTFLSRVFGANSADNGSMGYTEMTQIPLLEEEERSVEQDNDVRFLESDGASSSEEDEVSEGEIEPTHVFDGMTSVAFEDESDDAGFSRKGSMGSIPKAGQGESTEDEDDARGAVDTDQNRSRIAERRHDVYQKRRAEVDSEGDDNDIDQEESPLFAQEDRKSRGQNATPAFADAYSNIPFVKQATQRNWRKSSHGSRLEKDSFLYRKKSVWDEENQRTGPALRPPRFLHNITAVSKTPAARVNTLSPREKALWKWANVENLDIFLQEVYAYYLGNGFYCICISKILNLATLVFVTFISTYLGSCVDYSKLPSSHKFSQIRIDQCYSTQITGFTKFCLWMFNSFIILKFVQLYYDIRALQDIHNFYAYLLNISDKDLQTVPWQSVVEQIVLLKDQNAMTANVVEVKAKSRINAHDVANRIMRKDNYLIALFNSDILNLSLPIPLYHTSTLTKTLEWNLNLCVMGFAFNEQGYLKHNFLKHSQRDYLKNELAKRFMIAGFLNIILSPFLVAYFVLLYFFRYFNEFKTTPGALSSRQYTPIAEWKFREYNELYHLFQRRMGLSVEIANRYIDQFPKEKTNLILKFAAFISGSFVAILALLTILDPENFLNFELTQDRSVLFYISIFGTIWAACRSSLSDQYKAFDPEQTLKELIDCIHYEPKEWRGRYHSEQVKLEFCKLYNLKVILLLRELASLVLSPFILWFALPSSSGKIIDFIREVSVYVDGLGYVCKYATFKVKTRDHGNAAHAGSSSRVGRRNSQESDSGSLSSSSSASSDKGVDKMMQSYMYFIDDYQNKDNAVGKYQLPRNRSNNLKEFNDHWPHTNYSWKTQFELGGRSTKSTENSSKSRHADPSGSQKRHASTTKTRRNLRSSSPLNGDNGLGESFINSIPLQDYGHKTKTEELRRGNGVLGLINQYYKKSDVGR
ncbi:LAMI_0E15302g1_1 [Lachancea mirantina]|uniref:Autophagy-related protein 9 n=1 Tax=Lachancea mirantina TaxID=1230905 RepID=A0A1G4JS81_9SACH|nr:LAMI_0E15302g1_1 [Lachancea mirantina]